MRNVIRAVLILAVACLACGQGKPPAGTTTSNAATDSTADKKEITNLVRRMLNWAESKKSIQLLPVMTDTKDSVYTGFNFNAHDSNLERLRETGLFASEFINNYDRIIRTLDRKLKNRDFEYKTWLVGDLPIFNFANDVNPWCNCQDVPYENPWNEVQVTFQDLNAEKASLTWTWDHCAEGDRNFTYKVRAAKENGKWKIAWLQGFDFEEGTK